MPFVIEVSTIAALADVARYAGMGVGVAMIGLLIFGIFCAWKARR